LPYNKYIFYMGMQIKKLIPFIINIIYDKTEKNDRRINESKGRCGVV